ncbi:hypothetical protein, partial [Aeromonas caviae]|uniref:hypothetical protein n=1 Tax=Aeromonas caviae TaxID=648 RepID=UPI001FC80890
EIAGAAMMIYLQKRVIDQNGRSPSSTENSKIRCGMTGTRLQQGFHRLAKMGLSAGRRKRLG